MNKKTVVLGASVNPQRYSYMAVLWLLENDHEVVPVGIKDGEISGIKINKGEPELKDVHTVTLYLSAKNQEPYINYILSLNPSRIIFNPGAENPKLKRKAEEKNIETLEACTLTMLSTGYY